MFLDPESYHVSYDGQDERNCNAGDAEHSKSDEFAVTEMAEPISGSHGQRSTKTLWRKVLLIPIFFLIGEGVGIGVFLLWLKDYDTHLVFSWPLTFEDLLTYAKLAFTVILIPVYFAELGGHLIDKYFSSENEQT